MEVQKAKNIRIMKIVQKNAHEKIAKVILHASITLYGYPIFI